MELDIKPIIKWAGGKNKIKKEFIEIYNKSKTNRFIDLFCGSLSLPLILNSKNLLINDINSWLINTYKIIKKNPMKLIVKLEKLNSKKYNNKLEYNKIRDKYNYLKNLNKINSIDKINMASYFIYLNKRSFNGLYRENKNGKYNVPYRENKTEIFNKDNILNLSYYLNKNKIKIKNKSYKDFNINNFTKDDLIYLDPPYYPSKKSNFTEYWKEPFLIKQQEELFNFCNELNKKDIKFILSNSPCEEIKKLYKKFNMKTFYIGRQMRNAEGKSDVFNKKIEHNEILIWNF